MIFVTVGTHEQPFDRLLRKVDELKKDDKIEEEIVIQSGYSTYEPQYCECHKLLPYETMLKYVETARIVITHGGPASFMMPLQMGKIPIVVPRKVKYGEHVNDHQVEFARAVEKRYGNIIPAYDVEELGQIIEDYDKLIRNIDVAMKSNNKAFNNEIDIIVHKMFSKNKRGRL